MPPKEYSVKAVTERKALELGKTEWHNEFKAYGLHGAILHAGVVSVNKGSFGLGFKLHRDEPGTVTGEPEPLLEIATGDWQEQPDTIVRTNKTPYAPPQRQSNRASRRRRR